MRQGSEKLENWIYAALKFNDGEALIVDICKYIWLNHEADLRASGDLFFTWQYDMRWAGQELVKKGLIKKTKIGIKAWWVILK